MVTRTDFKRALWLAGLITEGKLPRAGWSPAEVVRVMGVLDDYDGPAVAHYQSDDPHVALCGARLLGVVARNPEETCDECHRIAKEGA